MDAPPAIRHEDPSTLRQKLRASTRECSDRGLHSAAKWSAELLASLVDHPLDRTAPPSGPAGDAHFRTSTPVRHPPGTSRQSLPGLPPMSSIAHAHRNRDSLGSVIGMEGSSPAMQLPESMHEDDEHDWPRDDPASNNAERDDAEQDLYTLALAYFRVHEHLRAAHTLKDCTGPRARWLRSYAKFLVRRGIVVVRARGS